MLQREFGIHPSATTTLHITYMFTTPKENTNMACSCFEVSIYLSDTKSNKDLTLYYDNGLQYFLMSTNIFTSLQVSEFLRMMMMFGGIGPGTPDVFRTINPDPHKVSMKKYMYTKKQMN